MEPLASRMRPQSLNEFVGQNHLIGKHGVLNHLISHKKLHSMIFWGPPGTGKTTLAKLLAKETNTKIFSINAINSGVKEIREIIEKAKGINTLLRETPILFIDEIHRFSKSQQDSLLKSCEDGIITLIGATTENPSFEVITALLSRCQVYTLEELSKDDLFLILNNAITNDSYLKEKNIQLKETKLLLKYSGGDARKLLTYLEIITNQNTTITDEIVQKIIKNNIAYDKKGEYHYDVISAFIKSIRGSDPQAALYYLAYMLNSGEDIKFIARRLVIIANEDIGLANSNATILAQSVFETISNIGMPEARIPLSHLVIYLATSPKSNSAYKAIDSALSFIKQNEREPVPLHLRNSPTKLMEELGYGKEYKYSHAYNNNFEEQEYFPKNYSKTVFYTPSKNNKENKIKEKLKSLWKNKYDL